MFTNEMQELIEDADALMSSQEELSLLQSRVYIEFVKMMESDNFNLVISRRNRGTGATTAAAILFNVASAMPTRRPVYKVVLVSYPWGSAIYSNGEVEYLRHRSNISEDGRLRRHLKSADIVIYDDMPISQVTKFMYAGQSKRVVLTTGLLDEESICNITNHVDAEHYEDVFEVLQDAHSLDWPQKTKVVYV